MEKNDQQQNGQRTIAPQAMSQPVQANLQPGMTARRDAMGGQELIAKAETASDFLTAQARAMVEARYARAMSRPRDIENVRVRLIKLCERWAFADEALYSKPVFSNDDEDDRRKRREDGGEGGIEGLSIRFAEAAIREMGNVSVDSLTVYDDPRRRMVRVAVEDLENGTVYSADLTVEKTVERRFAPDGATVLSKRMNHRGKLLYILPATDEQILNKANAIVSKTLRSLALRLIPPDVKGECEAQIRKTLMTKAKEDPGAAQRLVVDSFASLNVLPSQLAEFLGHPVDQCVPKEMVQLRALYQAIRDGEATWGEAMEVRQAQREQAKGDAKTEAKDAAASPAPAPAPVGQPPAPAAPPPAAPKSAADLAAKLKAEGKKAGKKKIQVVDEQTGELIDVEEPAKGSDG